MKHLSVFLFGILLCNSPIIAQKLISTKHWGTNVIKEQYQVNAQGERNGFYKSYNKDGILLFSYNFKNGIEHGLCIDYAGMRDYREIYCYGKPLSERVMDNGNIMSEKYYGCANNTNYLIFSKKLISTGVYEKVEYYKNGKISEKYNENASFYKETGTYEKYYENGKLAEKGMYNKGKFGTWIGFYETGDTFYVAKYIFGIEGYYKKFSSSKKTESEKILDENFETITEKSFYEDEQIKSEKIFKTYPFVYKCSRPNDPNEPKNWKELAERGIICGGDSYSPYDNCYLYSEKIYNANGDLESEISNELIVIDGSRKVVNKVELVKEEAIWNEVKKDSSYENIGKYFNETRLRIYFKNVNEIFRYKNDTYDKEIKEIKTNIVSLESEIRYSKERISYAMYSVEANKNKKQYVQFDIANQYIEGNLNKALASMNELNQQIDILNSEINYYLDNNKISDNIAKFNKKKLLDLIKKKIEITDEIKTNTELKKKLWDIFIASLDDKSLIKPILGLNDPVKILETLELK